MDDIDNLELLLAHALPEGIGNLMVLIMVYIVMFIMDWKLAILSLASIPLSVIAMKKMYSIGTGKMNDYYTSA